tara:strand:+ start:923 stop:1372 length:450 start_codon:yes stop_codon:yes gene_type:complete
MKNKFIYPGIFTRLMSFTYDIFLLVSVWFLFAALFVFVYMGGNAGTELIKPDDNLITEIIGPILLVSVTVGYYSFFWSKGRTTLGMSTWKHKIITEEGRHLSYRLAVLRLILYMVTSVLGMIWIIFDKENKCLPDKILKLRVVKKTDAS